MREYIIIHKTSEKKVIFSYHSVFGTLCKVEYSNERWSENEITMILREANVLKMESAFIEKMQHKFIDWDYLEMPRDLRFEVFWNTYGYKKGKIPATQKAWNSLTDAEKIEVLLYIPKFLESKKIDKTAMPYPSTFLNQKYWLADKI